MSIALYMNVRIPRAITDSLRLPGINILTAQEDNAANLSDSQLLDRARTLQRAAFTFDDDLLVIATQRQRKGIPFAGVIYAHPLRSSIETCVRDLEIIAKTVEPEDLVSGVEFLPLQE